MSYKAVEWALFHAPMLRTDKGLPDSTARQVLAVLAEKAHDDGTDAYPSPLRISFATGLDGRTVQRALRRLEVGGLIERDGISPVGTAQWKLRVDLRRPDDEWDRMKASADEERRVESELRKARRHRATEVASGTESPGQAEVSGTQSAGYPARKVPASGTQNPDVRHAAPPEPSVQPPDTHQSQPPPPPAPSPAATTPSAGGPGEEEMEIMRRKTELIDKVLALRPGWGRRSVIAAMATALDDGRSLDAIEYAFPIVAEDAETNAPGRLNADGPWWNKPEPARAPEPLPAGVHEFQPATNPGDTGCAQCALPRTNRYHYRPAAPNWDTSIHEQRRPVGRNGRRPFRNDTYTDAAYHQPL